MSSLLKSLLIGGDGDNVSIQGFINIPADFPFPGDVNIGDMYLVLTNVTDNDVTKTNTGQSFLAGDEIVWNNTDWTKLGSDSIWIDDGANIFPVNATRNLKIPSLTEGSIPYIGSGSVITQNNTALNWNNLLRRLIMGGGFGGTNTITGTAENNAILAGSNNSITGNNAKGAVIIGGSGNTISNANLAIILAGTTNTASGDYATVSGWQNVGSGELSVSIGGKNNLAAGDNSYAMGTQSKANHNGCFVISDLTLSNLNSTGVNQFLTRYSGGHRLTAGGLTVDVLNTVNGIVQTDGSGVFSSSITLPDGTLATTQSPGDNSTKLATTAFITAALPIAVEDPFIPTLGQTVFTLSSTPSSAAAFALYLNGQLREVTTDYTVSGTTLTWLDPGGRTLLTTDLLQARYNDVAISISNNWTDDLTDLTPTNAGRNIDIGTGGLKDNDVTTAIALGDVTNTDLDAAFTATSLIGAINENKISETFISKSFGDSPYSAVAGDNAISVDTSGGDVTITLPAATSNLGVRIRISKVTSDSNQVIIATTGGDTIGFQLQWTLSHQGDSTTAISDGISEWCLFTERHAAGFLYFLPDHDGNLGNHRVQNISGTGNANFEFRMPPDFLSIISLDIELVPVAAGSAGTGKNIDLTSDYCANGELFNNHTESDTSSTYDTGVQNQRTSIDISGVFTNVSANDICGLNVDHNSVGGTIAYYGIALHYLKKG